MSQGTKVLAQLLGLVALAAALGAYAYFGVFKKDQVDTEKKALAEKLITTTSKTEFIKLVVSTNGQTTVLERAAGSAWAIVSPVKAEVDSLVVDAMTSQLQQAKFKSTLEENPTEEDLKKYGLSAPQFEVDATTNDGTSVKLQGGIENPFDGSIYMRRNAEIPVYLAEGGVRWSLAKSTFDLRKKEVASVDEGQLKSLEVTAANNAYRLERNPDKSWQLVKPMNALADTNTITALVAQLKAQKAVAFVDAIVGRKRVAEVVMTTSDEKKIRLDFSVSQEDGGTKGYLQREDERGTVLAEVREADISLVDRNPFELRDKTIVSFKKELVTRIVFHNADGSEFAAEQEAIDGAAIASWRIAGKGPARTFKVTAVLWLLSTIKGAAFVDEAGKDLSKLGIDDKGRFIALQGSNGKELARFSIGAEVPNKPNIYFVRGTRPVIIEVDGARFNELPTSAADLLEPTDAGL